VDGRRAVILLSSGVDTFSKAPLDEVIKRAAGSDTPIYAVSFGELLRLAIDVLGAAAPSARINWNRAERDLEVIARASGGRLYSPTGSVDLAGIYDDVIENLKVPDVITYKSSATGNLNSPRTVGVGLVNPKTGAPIQIVDASGKTIHARVVLQGQLCPAPDSGRVALTQQLHVDMIGPRRPVELIYLRADAAPALPASMSRTSVMFTVARQLLR
jgi:hypothetical protein